MKSASVSRFVRWAPRACSPTSRSKPAAMTSSSACSRTRSSTASCSRGTMRSPPRPPRGRDRGRAAPDLHALPRRAGRAAHPRSLSPRRPLRRDGDAAIQGAAAEPRRPDLRDRGRPDHGRAARSTSSATKPSPTTVSAARSRRASRVGGASSRSRTTTTRARSNTIARSSPNSTPIEGYADFRVISSVAELTPDRKRLLPDLHDR